MKKYYFKVISMSFVAMIISSCARDVRDEENLTGINISNSEVNKTSVIPSIVYYLTEDFSTMCLAQNETTLSSLKSYTTSLNNYPTIDSPKWYGYNTGTNQAKTYMYFYSLNAIISNYYNLSTDKIKFYPKSSSLEFPEFVGDSSISRAGIYLNGNYGTFYPDNEISAETATIVMHALFNEIDNFSAEYNKNLYAISYRIEKTMCGDYMGLAVDLYYK